jgi:hypothetical protein
MSDPLGPIDPDQLYPKPTIMRLSGLGQRCLNDAQRSGALRVRFVGGRCFILGRDFVEWVENGKASKNADPKEDQ